MLVAQPLVIGGNKASLSKFYASLEVIGKHTERLVPGHNRMHQRLPPISVPLTDPGS